MHGTARNRDNTWPEELIKAVKEAKVKEEGAFEDASENIGETKPGRFMYIHLLIAL